MTESTIPTIEPRAIQAGINSVWTIYDADYLPTDSNTAKYYLVKKGNQIVLTGSDNGDGSHLFSLTAATTAAYEAGSYEFKLIIINGTDKFLLRSGSINIIEDFIAATGGIDPRSQVKKTLDAINASILGVASKEESEYSIQGKNLKRMDINSLILARGKYESFYKQEQDADRLKAGLQTRKKIYLRFN